MKRENTILLLILVTVVAFFSICFLGCSASRIERNLIRQIPGGENLKSATVQYNRDDTMLPVWCIGACIDQTILEGTFCIEGQGASLEEAVRDVRLIFDGIEK